MIDALKLQTQVSANDDRPALYPGDRLRIEHGPFANMEAVFHRFGGQERAIVLLNMLQKQHHLTLALKDKHSVALGRRLWEQRLPAGSQRPARQPETTRPQGTTVNPGAVACLTKKGKSWMTTSAWAS